MKLNVYFAYLKTSDSLFKFRSFNISYLFELLKYRVFQKNIFSDILGVSEKLISFSNLIIWPIPFQMISNFNSTCRNYSKFNVLFQHFFFFFFFFFSDWHFYIWKGNIKQNFELLLHMLFKFEIIWRRINHVIRLQYFLKQAVYHKWYSFLKRPLFWYRYLFIRC